MAKVPITLKQFRETPLETIAQRPERDRERILSQIRKSFIRQAKVLDKQQGKYFSHALDSYLRNYGREWNPDKNPNAKNVISIVSYDITKDKEIVRYYDLTNYIDPRLMSKNQILQELAQYHSFFTAKTSTIPGIKKHLKEVNKRLFGVNEKGRSASEMTLEESRKFWGIYNEFINSDDTNKSTYGSNPIQRAIAAIFVSMSPDDFKNWDLADAINEVREYLDMEQFGTSYDDFKNSAAYRVK